MATNVNFDKDVVLPIPILDAAGQTVTYNFEIQFEDGVNIHQVLMTDTLLGFTDLDLLFEVNAGNVSLSGDTNNNQILELGETWLFEEAGGSGIFTYVVTQSNLDSNGLNEPGTGFPNLAGSIENLASVTLIGPQGGFQGFESAFASVDLVIDPSIHIEKATNGDDADSPTGPYIKVGDPVTWTYVVTNTGNVALGNIVVTDDNGTLGIPGDDFNPTFTGGDTNTNGLLDVGETWTYSQAGVAEAGQYGNVAVVDGSYVPTNTPVSDDDPSHYFGANPVIAIVKETNGTDDDCPDILVGETVTWTYTVTNPGNVALSNVVVVDDNGTSGDTSDDFNPAFVGGDTNMNNMLDVGEAWTYEASGTAVAVTYENTATANGAFVDGLVNIAAPEASEDDCYTGVTAGIAIVKLTNGTNNVCPVVDVGSAIVWTYTVTNTGDLAIANVVVVDDAGTLGNPGDDFSPTFTGGDTNMNNMLDVGEAWTYSANGVAQAGLYTNVATVNGTASDDVGNTANVTDNEADCYEGDVPDVCVGVRTPGFWSSVKWGTFWDGIANNEPKQAGTPGFAAGELLYAVDSDNNGAVDATKGLLIGDFNHNGLTDAGEDTLFISLADAKAVINASNRQLNGGEADGIWILGRDLVATWLNYEANGGTGLNCLDNPGTGDDGFNPAHYINDAVNWLQEFASDKNDASENFAVFKFDAKVKTSSSSWKNDFLDSHSASEMHSALDGYNNTGFINGVEFCCSGDSSFA